LCFFLFAFAKLVLSVAEEPSLAKAKSIYQKSFDLLLSKTLKNLAIAPN